MKIRAPFIIRETRYSKNRARYSYVERWVLGWQFRPFHKDWDYARVQFLGRTHFNREVR